MTPIERGPLGLPPETGEAGTDSHALIRREYQWYHRLGGVLFVLFCLSIGFFLLIFPWTSYWERNYFSAIIPEWHRYWDNTYTRGAISGLGVVNLYIGFVEMFRLRRFSRHWTGRDW